MDKFTQARLYPNLNPTEHTANVYSTTVMHMVDGREKVLMSSPGKSNLITLEARTSYDGMETAVVELDFPNIPSDADIISILCVNRSKEFDDFVLGLTYASEAVEEDQNVETCFNVYSGSPGSSLEILMKHCETHTLDFLPFELNHVYYTCETRNKGMWLLSGSDKKIHAYKYDEEEICEQNIEEYFVEFTDTKDTIVLCFGTKSFSNSKKRVSFFGCDTGYSMIAIVDSEKNQILERFEDFYQSPITVVQLFNIYNKTVEERNILSVKDDLIPDFSTINEKEQVCFLVGSAEVTIVYMNVLEYHFRRPITLINNNRNQAVVTSLIADINFDSKKEILLGTHENFILNFVYENNTWVEQQRRDMRHLVYSICYSDITGEGVKDLVIASEGGIHILKHEPEDIKRVLKNRLKQYIRRN